MEKETFIVGDLHACATELKELLDKINYDPKTIRLIFLGDIVDRGPYGPECVSIVRKLCAEGAECVLGNHEQKHFRYRAHEVKKALTGKPNPMRPMNANDLAAHKEFTADDIEWMRNLPLTIHIKDHWYALHGGVEPAYPFNKQNPNQIIRCRYVNDEGKAVPLGENFTQPEGSHWWFDKWNGPESIISGHIVHSLTTPQIDIRTNGVKTIGIDLGCCFGGALCGYWFEREEFVQVKAKREYYKARFAIGE